MTPRVHVTMQEFVNLLEAQQAKPLPLIGPDLYATVELGGMTWCADVIRALQTSDVLESVSFDQLIWKFENSMYRWDFVAGY